MMYLYCRDNLSVNNLINAQVYVCQCGEWKRAVNRSLGWVRSHASSGDTDIPTSPIKSSHPTLSSHSASPPRDNERESQFSKAGIVFGASLAGLAVGVALGLLLARKQQ